MHRRLVVTLSTRDNWVGLIGQWTLCRSFARCYLWLLHRSSVGRDTRWQGFGPFTLKSSDGILGRLHVHPDLQVFLTAPRNHGRLYDPRLTNDSFMLMLQEYKGQQAGENMFDLYVPSYIAPRAHGDGVFSFSLKRLIEVEGSKCAL